MLEQTLETSLLIEEMPKARETGASGADAARGRVSSGGDDEAAEVQSMMVERRGGSGGEGYARGGEGGDGGLDGGLDVARAALAGAWAAVLGCLGPCLGESITLRDRRLRVVRTLGEGGFSFVFLVRDVATGREYACKRIVAQSEEQSRGVRWEVEVHKAFAHPSVLQLEDYQIRPLAEGGGEEALLLFPACLNGTLHDELMGHFAASTRMGQGRALQLFKGVCVAVREFHRHAPCWAHRDLKPGNVLLEGRNRVVLMDFGSVAEARVRVGSRGEALLLQDEAARNSSMAYRAPELWEAPTGSIVDERTDVWSLGCTLFAMTFGAGFSPFECQFSSGGAPQNTECSYLRVISQVPWPRKGLACRKGYSQGLVELIEAMLKQGGAERPSVGEVLAMVDALA